MQGTHSSTRLSLRVYSGAQPVHLATAGCQALRAHQRIGHSQNSGAASQGKPHLVASRKAHRFVKMTPLGARMEDNDVNPI